MKSTSTSAKNSPRKFPKGVWFQRKQLADGSVVRYGYYGKGSGTIALGREGSPEFFVVLARCVSKEPMVGTMHNLIWRYKQSPEFLRLQPRTRGDYMKFIDKIQIKFGQLSLRAMEHREIAQHIYAWRDSMADSPRRADYAVQVLKVLLSWGRKRGLLDENKALGVGRLSRGDRRECTWSNEQIAAFQAVAPPPLQRAMIMALETGQRQGDLLALRWSAVQGNVILLKQAKTGVRVAVPISPALAEALGPRPDDDDQHVLLTHLGAPWDAKGNGFRSGWRDAAKAAGIVGRTFHDLRGTFVTRKLAQGWTPHEVAMCTGHSLRDLAMLDTYADRRVVSEATAARLHRQAT